MLKGSKTIIIDHFYKKKILNFCKVTIKLNLFYENGSRIQKFSKKINK